MKNLLVFLFLIPLISCNKEKLPVTESLLIEEYVYDSSGVVFKIVNDVDSLFNYQENIKQKIDSFCIGKFQSFSSNDKTVFDSRYYTWFTKKGQYVCWRYKYLNDPKYLRFFFYNPFRRYSPYEYCYYLTYYSFDEKSVNTWWFQKMFPYPKNDTVQVHILSLFEVAFPH